MKISREFQKIIIWAICYISYLILVHQAHFFNLIDVAVTIIVLYILGKNTVTKIIGSILLIVICIMYGIPSLTRVIGSLLQMWLLWWF